MCVCVCGVCACVLVGEQVVRVRTVERGTPQGNAELTDKDDPLPIVAARPPCDVDQEQNAPIDPMVQPSLPSAQGL